MNLDPQRTVFVLLSFEGPDVYSMAGGLATRVKGLSRSLARMGYTTYLYFCGDPELPGEEAAEGGRLQLRRWCQWISAQHRGGVYDGEEGKIRDWNYSLPPAVVDRVIGPAVAEGKQVVVLGEEWHTSWSMRLISDTLYYRGLRDRAVMLWNANNTFGFNRIEWPALNLAATVTTVSRYMKSACGSGRRTRLSSRTGSCASPSSMRIQTWSGGCGLLQTPSTRSAASIRTSAG